MHASKKPIEAGRRMRASNPVRKSHARAQLAVNRAIEKGILQRGACEVCGASGKQSNGVERVYGHHDNYNRPLDVRWLCTKCHGLWHRENEPVVMLPDLQALTIGQLIKLGIEQKAGSKDISISMIANKSGRCLACGKPYAVFSVIHRFCSGLCRLRGNRKRKKETA
jgi:hypothetical protein